MHALRNERNQETADIAEAIENMKAIADHRSVGPDYNNNNNKLTVLEDLIENHNSIQ